MLPWLIPYGVPYGGMVCISLPPALACVAMYCVTHCVSVYYKRPSFGL